MDLQKMEGQYNGIVHKIRVMLITPILQLGEATPINDDENSTETPSGQAGNAAPSQNDSRGGAPPDVPPPTDEEKAFDPSRMEAIN